MKVEGTRTIHEQVEIEITPSELFALLYDEVWKKTERPEGFTYINDKGVWEHWENGHGSGYTTYGRVATPDELAIDAALVLISKTLWPSRARDCHLGDIVTDPAAAPVAPLPLGLIVQIMQARVVGLVARVVPISPTSERYTMTPDGCDYDLRLFRDFDSQGKPRVSDDPADNPIGNEWRITMGAADIGALAFQRALDAAIASGWTPTCWDEFKQEVVSVDAYRARACPPRPSGPVKWCDRCGIWTGAWPAYRDQPPTVIAPCGGGFDLEAETCSAGWRIKVVTTSELHFGSTVVMREVHDASSDPRAGMCECWRCTKGEACGCPNRATNADGFCEECATDTLHRGFNDLPAKSDAR